jgi:hypothetical protein
MMESSVNTHAGRRNEMQGSAQRPVAAVGDSEVLAGLPSPKPTVRHHSSQRNGPWIRSAGYPLLRPEHPRDDSTNPQELLGLKGQGRANLPHIGHHKHHQYLSESYPQKAMDHVVKRDTNRYLSRNLKEATYSGFKMAVRHSHSAGTSPEHRKW